MLRCCKKMGANNSHAAFLDYRVGAAHISSKGLKIIKSMLNGHEINFGNSKMSKREWNELMDIFPN